MATTPGEDWRITAVEHASARISDLARNGDLGQPITHLNRWKVRDLVAHLGGVQRWATQIIDERSMAVPGFKKSKFDGVELCDWFDEGAQQLLTTFRTTGLDQPCPNFNPGSDRTVAWWARRQAHEATVHLWDLDQSLQIEATAAADGVDEFLDVFVRTRGKQTLASTLVLRTEGLESERAWTLTPAEKPGRIDVAAGQPGVGTVVSGPSAGLLLALWGRLSAAEAGLTISGDRAAAASLIAVSS